MHSRCVNSFPLEPSARCGLTVSMFKLLGLGLCVATCFGAEGVRCFETDGGSGFSRAVIVDDLPLIYTTQFVAEGTVRRGTEQEDATVQTKQVLAKIAEVLDVAGSSLDRVVKLNVYLARTELRSAMEAALKPAFTGPEKPAISFVSGTLSEPAALVAMDVVAVASTERARLAFRSRDHTNHIRDSAILPAGSKHFSR